MLSTAADTATVSTLLADPRVQRLLTQGREMNDILSKIVTANAYLSKEGVNDFEEVEIARNQLARDLTAEFNEVRSLLPSLDEIVEKLQDHVIELRNRHKMSSGLAKIEGLSGSKNQARFEEAAASTKVKIEETDNLIEALDALQADLSTPRKRPHGCPRCMSTKVSYRITPSELGFTLYKCDDCGNAWRITQFTLRHV